MKAAEAREAYYTATGKASDVARQLGFAGIAIIWLFNNGNNNQIVLPSLLLWAGLCISAGLAADFLQYASAAVVWGLFHRTKERSGVSEDTDFLARRQMNWPANSFFWLKLVLIPAGYAFIILHLSERLRM